MIYLVIILSILLLFFLALYIVFRICFMEYRTDVAEELEKLEREKEFYGTHFEAVRQGICNVENDKNYEEVEITAFDGVKLKGRYYERAKEEPTVIFMHGYHGVFQRDGMGIFSLGKKKGYNVLLPSQRAQGLSGGKAITFGIKERYDVKCWVEYIVKRNGENQKILISGLSMGAGTVMMAADVGLPDNVKGIMADCGFSSPKEIICSVMKSLRYPVKLMYPLVKLAALVYGGFHLEEASAVESLKYCKIPVLMIHGKADTFVPTYMSIACHDACASEKELLLVEEAGHGMSYCYDAKAYEDAVLRFFERTLG